MNDIAITPTAVKAEPPRLAPCNLYGAALDAIEREGRRAKADTEYLMLMLHWLEHHSGRAVDTDHGPADLEHLIDAMAGHRRSKKLFKALRRFAAGSRLWDEPHLLARRLRAVVAKGG